MPATVFGKWLQAHLVCCLEMSRSFIMFRPKEQKEREAQETKWSWFSVSPQSLPKGMDAAIKHTTIDVVCGSVWERNFRFG